MRVLAASGPGAPLASPAAAPRPPPRVVVIGGGVGGLAAAGRLSRAGTAVTLLEKNPEVGGRVQSATLDGWRFDTGPSLLLFPQKYAETFEALGTTMEAALDVRRVGPAAYRVFFPGSGPAFRIDLLNDPQAMADQLEALEPGAGAAYPEFLRMARSNLDMGLPNFIDRDFTELADARNLFDLLPKLSSVNPWKLLGPHDRVMRGFFKDPRLRAAFTFQDLYVGLSPATAPAVFSLLAGTELTDSVWYPVGGFVTVRDALSKAAEACGVAVRTAAGVAAVETDAAGAVTGVTLEGSEEFIPADVVVCNRDMPAAYSLLQQQRREPRAATAEHAARRERALGRLKYSAGVIAYNWCIRGQLPELTHHNVVLSEEWERAWRPATAPSDLPRYPNFYVHVPNRTDPTAAPPGCESVMVLLPVACMQGRPGGADFDALVAAGREAILRSFAAAGVGGGAEIGAMIERELVIAPPAWEERYGVRHGAAFGLAHGLDQLSLFRPGNRDDAVPGLYFVGASTRPGNGVPLCLISAKLTAERVLKDWAAEGS